jgi:hypothetical protein
MNQELRLYVFVNFYLSSIQQGIQSAHVVHSLFTKYPDPVLSKRNELLWNWARNHKTMIVLNGGANSDIHEIFYTLEQLQHTRIGNMPFECFHEDENSLGSVMTAVGVVVPEQFFNATQGVDSLSYYTELSDGSRQRFAVATPEHRFITMLKSCGLAR